MRRSLMLPILALCALCPETGIAQPADQGFPQTVTVEMSSFRFTPTTLTLQRGKNYKFHFVNTSSGGHNFAAGKFFLASSIAAQDQRRIVGGKIELRGGESIDINLVPLQAGTFKIRCSHFMHGAFGMKGAIIVQ